MFESLVFTELSVALAFVLAAVFAVVFWDRTGKKLRDDGLVEPPCPRSLPIVGHLHLIGGYEVPYQAFTNLGAKYGDVVKLRLGGVRSVVVNGQRNIREVLVTKGNHFDSRPNFERYRMLFCGNRENSLAFCDWSHLQKTRRDMLKAHTFPRSFTANFDALEDIISVETDVLLSSIRAGTKLKTNVLQTCANIFTNHFCSTNFTRDDPDFTRMVENFDDIFYEVNQGYAADFLPFLLPFHSKRLSQMNTLTHKIRDFILERIIRDRDGLGDDYVDSLIRKVNEANGTEISWETALFALEDIVGGHSAVANFVVKILGFLVNEDEVQRKIQEEIDAIADFGRRNVRISDRSSMPYTEGAIFEAIRLIASPIVPRVANQNSSINGYRIEKGSLIFLNNYELSMSEELWEEPKKFKPERFLVDGRFVKPEHFLPFGGGRRSCMGYKMVQLVTFGILTALLQNFDVRPLGSETYKVPIGSLALPRETFEFDFVSRTLVS